MRDVVLNTDARGSGPQTAPVRRRVLAWLPLVAGGLLVLGQTLTPHGLDKPITSASRAATELQIAAMHTDRLYASNLLVVFGLGVLGLTFLAVASRACDAGSRLAVTAAVAGVTSAFCGALVNMLIGYDLAAAATSTSPAAARVLVAENTSTAAHLLIAGYLVGGLVAILLIGALLWRSPEPSRWLAPLFGIGLLAAALAPPGLVALPISLPFLFGCGLLGRHIGSRPRDARAAVAHA